MHNQRTQITGSRRRNTISEIEELYERIDNAGEVSPEDAAELRLAVDELLTTNSEDPYDSIDVHNALSSADHYLQCLIDGSPSFSDDDLFDATKWDTLNGLGESEIPF